MVQHQLKKSWCLVRFDLQRGIYLFRFNFGFDEPKMWKRWFEIILKTSKRFYTIQNNAAAIFAARSIVTYESRYCSGQECCRNEYIWLHLFFSNNSRSYFMQKEKTPPISNQTEYFTITFHFKNWTEQSVPKCLSKRQKNGITRISVNLNKLFAKKPV